MSVIKTVILCGGMGTRMKEETEFRPKPLVHVGERPILWHIMKTYNHYGHNNFVFALGYKSEMIKNYFLRQKDILNDFTLDVSTNRMDFHNNNCDEFKITFAETGMESHTGERILRIKKYITENEFMVTYGDGVSDIDINALIKFHREQKTIGTITGVHPHAKYGFVKIHDNSNLVQNFEQKPVMFDYVNGGFMIFNKEAFDYFDETPMESGLIKLAKAGQLSVYKHDGFWKAMDTYREVLEMNDLWTTSKPWAVWLK
jgi:glucose-1-phosphate cytidylyltransferase